MYPVCTLARPNKRLQLTSARRGVLGQRRRACFARGAACSIWRRGAVGYRCQSAALAAERRSVRRRDRETVTNPFAASWVAPEYAASRPDVHWRFIEVAHQEMGSPAPLPWALDVGCGTGLACRALLRVARRVVGIDPSAAMLRHAMSVAGVSYATGRAEAIPIGDATFDIACVSSAFQWCDPQRLIPELGRVVRPKGWLIIFDSILQGWSGGSAEPVERLTEEYWSRLPYCPRNPYFSPTRHRSDAFGLHASRVVSQAVRLSAPELSAFILTQASTVAAVESGHATLAELRARLVKCLHSLFAGAATRELLFGGTVHILIRR